MRYEKTLRLDKAYLEKIRGYLNNEPTCEEECLGEDETFSEFVRFENGYYMDIYCCGVQYREGESNTAWTEALLYADSGVAVAFTEPCDEFEGEWELEDDEGNTYAVNIVSKD